MAKEIPEDIRRKQISGAFTWVTNTGPEIYHDPEMLIRHTLGKPHATAKHSEEELIKMGMAGLYRPNGPS